MSIKKLAYMHFVTAACNLFTKRTHAFSILGDQRSLRQVSGFPHNSLNRDRRFRVSFYENKSHTSLGLPHTSKLIVTTKRYNSRGSGKDDEERSLLTKAFDKIKSVIPFLKDDKQKTAELARKESSTRLSSEIDRIFQDAPFGLRMMGKIVSPLIRSLAGGLVEAARQQTRQMDELLNECQDLILSDYVARQALGEVINVESPFSQSSSVVSVNGVTRKQVEARFQVTGNKAGGIATLYATERGIESLILNVNGRRLNINTSEPVSVTTETIRNIGKNKKFGKDDIIDAELVEKVKK